MTDFRERLKKTQSEGSFTPNAFKKRISTYFDMKKVPVSGEPAFRFYDKETKYHTEAINGILIGSAMKLTAFDPRLKPRGGSYTSTIFYSYDDKGAVYSSHDQGPIYGGSKNPATMEQCKAFIAARTGDKITNHKIFWVLTLNGKVIQIETNISLAIDNLNSSKERDIYVCSFTPTKFSPDDTRISAKTIERMGPLAATNPPTYCFLGVTDNEITEEMAERLELLAVLDEYEEYKQLISEGRKEEEDDLEAIASQASADESYSNSLRKENPFETPNKMPESNSFNESFTVPEDDLPF